MSSSGQGPKSPFDVNRRDVLRISSLAALAATGTLELQGCKRTDPVSDRLRISRLEDMVLAELGLVGIIRAPDDLTLTWSSAAARLTLVLQPQHILEGAYWTAQQTPDDPVPTRLSGPSQLVFKPPTSSGSMPFTLAGILEALRDWPLAVDPRATPSHRVPAPLSGPPALPSTASIGELLGRLRQLRNAATAPTSRRHGDPFVPTRTPGVVPRPVVWRRPAADVTRIELPFRLQLSPHIHGRFLHPSQPSTGADGVVGLWASRLAALGPQGQPAADRFDAHRSVRAIWTRDLDPPDLSSIRNPPDDPIRADPARLDPFHTFPAADTTVSVVDRVHIALQSSHPDLRLEETGRDTKPAETIAVERLWLSALGGGLDARGGWSESHVRGHGFVNLVGWTHQTTLGRDHYVEVTRAGYLWPCGNRAVYVEVSERSVDPSSNKAILQKRGFIVLVDVVRDWIPTTGSDGPTWRRAPLRSVTFLDTVVECADIASAAQEDAGEVPMVPNGTAPARARVLLEDRLGRSHDTSLGFVFFTGPHIDPSRIAGLNQALAPVGELPMRGQRIAYDDQGDPAGTIHETQALRWEGTIVDGQVFPQLVEASLVVDAARSLLPKSSVGHEALRMVLHDAYLDHGLVGGGNPRQVLFGLAPGESGPMLDFGSDSRRSGGFAAPSFVVGGISARTGVIGGDASTLAATGFDAVAFFGGAFPKLFGVLDLVELIASVDPPTLLSSGAVAFESLMAAVERLVQLGDVVLPSHLKVAQGALDDAVFEAGQALGHAAVGDFGALQADFAALHSALTDLQAEMTGPTPIDPALKAIQPLIASLDEALLAAASTIASAQTLAHAVESREVRLSWEVPLHDVDGLFEAGEPLVLSVVAGSAGVDLTCRLDDFELSLFGIVRFPVERFSYLQRSGSKPDIDVILAPVELLGVLRFVQTILDALPLDGFSDPPAIDVTEEGLTATLSLPLPNLAVGAFSLENVHIGARVEIPFIGDAVLLDFAFSSRDNPFALTVLCIGGGGFVGVEVTPNGLRVVEVALEARASVSLDFGVASGSVSVALGIYMNLHMPTPDAPEVVLMGYVRVRGSVRVMGVATVSLTLMLLLEYQAAGNKLYGEAKATLEISVLCFSGSVTVRVRRRLAGDNQDPTFLDTMAPVDPTKPMLGADSTTAPWALYVNAFDA